MIRNIYDFDTPEETSFWYVIKDTFSDLTEFSSKVRNQVKKSLKVYDFIRVTADEMLQNGFPIFKSALSGYKVKTKALSKDDFVRRVEHDRDMGNVDFWFVKEKQTGKYVALAINTLQEGCCNYRTLKAMPEYLHNSTYPYYGLIYMMNKYYLETVGVKYVSDGARSITEHSNIQPFLIDKFKFRKAYCRLQIKYKFWVRIVVTLAYPFRKITPILQIKSILNMEAMRRGEY